MGDIFETLSHAITLRPGKVCCYTVLNNEFIIRSFLIGVDDRQPPKIYPIQINLLLFGCFASCWKK